MYVDCSESLVEDCGFVSQKERNTEELMMEVLYFTLLVTQGTFRPYGSVSSGVMFLQRFVWIYL